MPNKDTLLLVDEERQCVICQNDLTIEESNVRYNDRFLNCQCVNNVFHQECFDNFVAHNGDNTKCPLCMNPMIIAGIPQIGEPQIGEPIHAMDRQQVNERDFVQSLIIAGFSLLMIPFNMFICIADTCPGHIAFVVLILMASIITCCSNIITSSKILIMKLFDYRGQRISKQYMYLDLINNIMCVICVAIQMDSFSHAAYYVYVSMTNHSLATIYLIKVIYYKEY